MLQWICVVFDDDAWLWWDEHVVSHLVPFRAHTIRSYHLTSRQITHTWESLNFRCEWNSSNRLIDRLRSQRIASFSHLTRSSCFKFSFTQVWNDLGSVLLFPDEISWVTCYSANFSSQFPYIHFAREPQFRWIKLVVLRSPRRKDLNFSKKWMNCKLMIEKKGRLEVLCCCLMSELHHHHHPIPLHQFIAMNSLEELDSQP